MIFHFFYGLSFAALGLAAFLQLRQGGDLPLRNQLPWLAAFGFACGATGWIDMFLVSETAENARQILNTLRIIFQPLTGLLLLIFGWRILTHLSPLPSWTVFIPGVLIVPIAFVITYASTTFITPSPIEIPIDIWSRYLLYLPGSIMAGVGFLRQWREQKRQEMQDVANLMLGAGLAFLFEAFVVGLVVPAAPYGPASYYNYDRVMLDAFIGEQINATRPFGLSAWLDYQQVLEVTGFPIEFWRMLSAFAVTFFVLRGLDVFDAIRKRQVRALEADRDQAQQAAYTSQIVARQTAESWADTLTSISRRIAELDDVDNILIYIAENARILLRSDFIGLAIMNGDSSQLELKCFCTASQTQLVKLPTAVNNPVLLNTLQNQQSYSSPEGEPANSLEAMCFFSDKPARAAAAVGLDLDTRPIGVLWVARFQAEPYSETDVIWLESLADQVEIAINHGLMTSQLQTLSVVEERGRIAREMHDGLAQVLGYMNLQVQTLEALLQQGKSKVLQAELAQMRQAIQVAHADVRENILSLRTTLANEKGLVAAAAEYLEEFGLQVGVETEFDCDISEELAVSSLAEVQLVCILQEALTNVRKHAHARRVKVLLRKELIDATEQICMTVADDGMGFALSDSRRSFGLQTMRERAQSVNGKLSVYSTPGNGSIIECRLPCLQPENLKKPSVVFS